ncbi:M60 family metallopeptidase [Candidatus Enterococcus mangumiae]|uniref:S-layer protein n=1 Tax=Candidatus Enterococcus mangumiae TaxID=2230878 RepID=A0ABZ2SXG3_9ENTE|nr:M60 family metallopeptidase [Enterococcus sp. DIV1094]MBO0490146.1 M60 family metallopeptidase [Enterococcus sp. DIV1094]
MKKTLLFSAVLLGMVMYSEINHADEVIDKNETSTAIQTNQNVSTKLEIKQSENLNAYKANILNNTYGPSSNQSTGIYKRANDVIEIYVDENTDQSKLPTYSITGAGLTDYLEGWTRGIQLNRGRNVISGTQVGIIHIQNEQDQLTSSGKVNIEIKGGITIPRFILGETTNAQWDQIVANHPGAPGYELLGERVLITGSSRSIHLVRNPTNIVETQDKVIKSHDKISGLDNSASNHRTPVGLVQHMRETHSAGAYMYAYLQHTGYHADTMYALLMPERQEQWGMYHEIGHTYQMNRMNWNGLTEVTVNIYSLRAEKEFGIRSRLERDNRYTSIFNYLNSTGQKQFDSQNVWTKLAMFWQLELAFGEDFYPNLHKMYRNEQRSLPSEQDKRQYFVVAASKISGRNLQPFFQQWGIDVTAESRLEMEKLPKLTKKIWEYRDEMTGDVGNIDGEDNNSDDKEAPTIPTGLATEEVTSNSVKIKWNQSVDNTKVKGYRIYRNGVRVGTTETLDYTDKNLASDTAYVYQVSAFDEAGNESEKTQFITVVTKQEEKDTQAPSIPTGLTAGTVTANSAQFSWGPSTDNNRVAGYNVYRNGVKVNSVSGSTFTDTNLSSNTAYTYQVSAYDAAGNESEKSQAITITTKDQSVLEDTWRIDQVYTTGNLVIYNGIQYRAKWWIKGERPDISQAWEKTDKTQIEEWVASKAYSGGDRVSYKGKTYEAKWWNTNANPETSDVWVLK